MSSPLESHEFGNLYVGDTHDDDGRVIDSLVQEVDAPATPVVEPIKPTPLIEPKHISRMLTGAYVYDNTQIANYTAPIQILPADANRESLIIRGFSYAAAPTIADFVYVADENGKPGTTSAARLRPIDGIVTVPHTGAVYIYPNSAITGLFEVTWWATTK